jgi:hypothetical protein
MKASRQLFEALDLKVLIRRPPNLPSGEPLIAEDAPSQPLT